MWGAAKAREALQARPTGARTAPADTKVPTQCPQPAKKGQGWGPGGQDTTTASLPEATSPGDHGSRRVSSLREVEAASSVHRVRPWMLEVVPHFQNIDYLTVK